VDLVRFAYYPFLPGVRDAVRELGPDLADLLSAPLYAGVRERGVERVEGALGERRIPPPTIHNDRDALAELLALAVARMLCVLLGDRTLLRRYAAAESLRVQSALDRDRGSLAEVAAALGVAVENDGAWSMHFSDFLAVAPSEPDWKLIQFPLTNGRLPLSDAQLVVLCARAYEARIDAELAAELAHPVHADVRAGLQPYIDALAPKLAEAREDWNTGDFGPVQDVLFPPCMTTIFQEMKDGKMVSHHARFAVASFLATIGMSADDILDYFRQIPNFDADKSRYQITHIAGEQGVEKYTPPGCATMQTNGICPLEKRDNLCFKIKHPLSYYRARIRFQDEDRRKAEQVREHEKRKKEALAGAEVRSG